MLKLRDYIIIAGVFLFIICSFLYKYVPLYSETCHYAGLLTCLTEPIAGYIRQNQGQFPASEDDLVNQYFMKKEKVTEGFNYSFTSNPNKPGPNTNWNLVESDYFETLTISYGAKLDNIEVVDGRLFDKETGSQVLLIDGPEIWGLKSYYENPTLYWYEEMLRYQKDKSAGAQEAESDNDQ